MHMPCLYALVTIGPRELGVAVSASLAEGIRAVDGLARIPFDFFCHQTRGGQSAPDQEAHEALFRTVRRRCDSGPDISLGMAVGSGMLDV